MTIEDDFTSVASTSVSNVLKMQLVKTMSYRITGKKNHHISLRTIDESYVFYKEKSALLHYLWNEDKLRLMNMETITQPVKEVQVVMQFAKQNLT